MEVHVNSFENHSKLLNEVMNNNTKSKFKFPEPMLLLFYIFITAFILSYIVPSGEYERITNDLGRQEVVADTFAYTEKIYLSLFDFFNILVKGLESSSSIIFLLLISGAMFNIIGSTGALKNAVGILVE